MSLFFITGVSGSGKSAVWQGLKARGYDAFDTDEDGFAKWHNNQNGYVHPKSSVKPEQRTEEFLEIHSWKVPRQEIEELAGRATAKAIFLCGVASNENELWDLFKAVFELVIDDEMLKHRLLTRTNNDWGKQPHELQKTLEEQHNIDQKQNKFDRIVIDATRPIEVVVEEILQKVTELESADNE
jgi:dephospho-CoA kinase